jgi:hypothetical protein
VNFIGEIFVHCSLGRRTNRYRLFQLVLTTRFYPGHLGRKALDVILLFLEVVAGNEKRIVTVSDTNSLDLSIKEVADLFPRKYQRWVKNVAA